MPAEERAGAFIAKPVWQRAAVVAAGPIANFILSIAIFATIFMLFGRIVAAPVVDVVQPDSAAAAGGLKPGDMIVSVDGDEISTFSDLQRIVSVSANKPLILDVKRGDETVTLTVTPQYRELKDRFGNVQRIGLLGVSRSLQEDDLIHETFGPDSAVVEGGKET